MTRICIRGDSIAWGANDYEKEGWVNRLKHYFLNKTKGDISVYNLGVSGDNSDKLIKRFEIECMARKPDVIIFAIGINDSQYVQNKNNPRVALDKFSSNLQYLIDTSKKYCNNIIFLGLTNVIETKVMPIPWDPIKYYDNENIRLYDTQLKDTTTKNNVPYIYLFKTLEDKDLEDGLHPGSIGHEKIFKIIREYIIKKDII